MKFRETPILNNVFMSSEEIKHGIYRLNKTLEINCSIGIEMGCWFFSTWEL